MYLKKSFTLSIIFLISLILGIFSRADAQTDIRINIEMINDEKFPQVEAYVSVSDVQGFPIKDLTKENFTISEDDKAVTNLEVAATENTEQPLSFVLVMDTSGSMGVEPQSTGQPTKPTSDDARVDKKNKSKTAPLQNAIEAAKSFIKSLAPQDKVALVSFSDEVSVVQDLTADKDLVLKALDTLKPEKNTAMYDGIVKGIDILKNLTERKVVILLTDGRDSGPGISAFSFNQMIDEASRWAVPVYPVGFGDIDEKELQRIAELTGGVAQIKPDSSVLQEAFSTILQILRQQYLLKFTSQLPADGNEHEIIITLNYGGWQGSQSRHIMTRPGNVSVTLPDYTNGQIVGGRVLFSPQVTSPAPIAQLDITIDGQPLTSVYSPPFQYVWDSATVLSGEHDLVFTMKDIAGNSGQTSVRLLVQAPISVEILSPKPGENINAPTRISAKVSAFAKVAKVEFKVDDKVLGTLQAEPYEVQWPMVGIESGPHEIVVTAIDINSYSAEKRIMVTVGESGGGGLMGIVAIIAALAIAGILIPFGLRSRMRRRKVRPPTYPPSQGAILSPISPSPYPSMGAHQAALRELSGLNPNRVWYLSGQGEIRMGRKREENDVPLAGQTASRRHAVIRHSQGYYYLYNLRTDNPVLVNGNPIMQQHMLQPGDLIQAGDSIFRFEA